MGAGKTGTAGPMESSLFLRHSRDIEWVKQGGRRISMPLFNLQIRQENGTETKLGIIVGRRFGTAVKRNRTKRLFRELGRAVHQDLAPGYRLLVFPKKECLVKPFAVLREAWREGLERSGLIAVRGVRL
jgi:ribonuclease P protein component